MTLILAKPAAAPPAGIAFNNAADLGGSDSISSLSVPYTLGTGSNLLFLLIDGADNVDDISGATYAGAAMTLGWKFPGSAGVYDTLYAFFLGAPATGTNNVVITSASSHRIRAVAADYTGMRQTGQPDAVSPGSAANNTASITDTVTTVASGAWAIAGMLGYQAGNPPTAGTGSTRRVYGAFYGMPTIFDSGGPITPPRAYSMTVTTSAPVFGGMRIVSFSPG